MKQRNRETMTGTVDVVLAEVMSHAFVVGVDLAREADRPLNQLQQIDLLTGMMMAHSVAYEDWKVFHDGLDDLQQMDCAAGFAQAVAIGVAQLEQLLDVKILDTLRELSAGSGFEIEPERKDDESQ